MRIKVKIQESNSGFAVAAKSVSDKITVKLDAKYNNTIISSADYYDGDYEVEPDFVAQVLETTQKTMRQDVIVHPIEVQRVTNAQGGKTVYIGGYINA